MKKIVILASDTPHRRFFIKSLHHAGIPIHSVVFELESIKPKFPTGPFLEKEETQFESVNFFKDFDSNLKVFQIERFKTINDTGVENYLKSVNPDLGIVFGTRKLSGSIINLFSDFCINVHRGIAEEYRGLDTNLWALYHKDFDNMGVTIHKVDNNLDTGDIIFQKKVSYPKTVELFQMRYYETLLCAQLIIEATNNFFKGDLKYRKQEKAGRYYSFMPLVLKPGLDGNLRALKRCLNG